MNEPFIDSILCYIGILYYLTFHFIDISILSYLVFYCFNIYTFYYVKSCYLYAY